MKKAELSMTVIVTTILLLVVLVLLIIAFQDQFSGLINSLKELFGGATDSAKDVNVEELLK